VPLVCALDADARWVAHEASYEALAVLDEDEHVLQRVVETALAGSREVTLRSTATALA
jgi:hypothetical protein